MRFISDLKEGDLVSQVFFCKTKSTQTTKAGKGYYSLIFQDKTGTVDAKVWDLNSAAIDNFESGVFIFADGQVISINNSLQINVRRVRIAGEGEYVPEDFFPVSTKNIDDMYALLLKYVEKIDSPKMKELVESFFVKDEEFIKAFKKHSAAKSIHHGFVGGLLEHTLAVTRLCYCYCSMYPQLNKDLLLTAAMFHDIGKLKEISDFPQNDYTDEGQLLGHIVMGCEMVGERIKTIPGFPEKTALELKHCILAHHGELEYGSPKKPALMEATALYFADNTDAKMQTFIEQVAGATSNDWLGFNRVIDSNVRKSTPIEV